MPEFWCLGEAAPKGSMAFLQNLSANQFPVSAYWVLEEPKGPKGRGLDQNPNVAGLAIQTEDLDKASALFKSKIGGRESKRKISRYTVAGMGWLRPKTLNARRSCVKPQTFKTLGLNVRH